MISAAKDVYRLLYILGAANLGQECLLINQDKNQNKNNVSCRLVSIEFINSPDVSDDVTAVNTK